MRKHTVVLVLLLFLMSCKSHIEKSDAYGNFEAIEVIVSPEAQGKLVAFNLEEGQKLRAGEIVGLIDTTDLTLKREQLVASRQAILSGIASNEAQIMVQQQQKDNLMIDKVRIEKMLKDSAATQKQMDDISGSINLVDKQIESLKTQRSYIMDQAKAIDAQIAQVQESIRKCHLVNPVKGTVLTKYAEEGEVTSFGKPLYKIANIDTIELKVYISGAQLPGVKLGQKVDVLVDRDAATNRKLEGTVSWISSQAEFTPKIIQTKEERVNLVYAMKVLVPNDGTLKIGMPGEINF
jgi:HlyD family secretion protein